MNESADDLKALVASSPFDVLMGTEAVAISKDSCHLRLPLSDKHTQPIGLVHGGVLSALAETAASVGAMQNSPTGRAVGQSNHTEFLRAGRLDAHENNYLDIIAEPVHVGRQVQVWTVSIFDGKENELAKSSVRLFNV